jgi:3-deoxy-manno-octulosonate cytidylyltransferase (CMP-KDO synthetase)
LPGKPLIDICGKTLIHRVWERVAEVLPAERIFIATDDARIIEEGNRIGAQTLLTDTAHINGTTRCLEAAKRVEKRGLSFRFVLNIQGDEPLLEKEQIISLTDTCLKPDVAFATLVMPVVRKEDLENESEVFVAFSKQNKALYFSRAVIPAVRGLDKKEWFGKRAFYKHIGLYAYTLEVLEAFAALPCGDLEQSESLEQLRWLEAGGSIHIGITHHDSIPVDTPEDLERVRKMIGGANI